MSDDEYDPNQGYENQGYTQPVQKQTSFAPTRQLDQGFQPNEYAKPVAQPIPQYATPAYVP
tara:strand:- start:406 stop:588 length:183 start_codon:yes stop_codon:yes gene_type:complete